MWTEKPLKQIKNEPILLQNSALQSQSRNSFLWHSVGDHYGVLTDYETFTF